MANAKSAAAEDKKIQLSLRISKQAKDLLNAHCAYRQAQEGSPVSYNQAILDLIEQAPLRKSRKAKA